MDFAILMLLIHICSTFPKNTHEARSINVLA